MCDAHDQKALPPDQDVCGNIIFTDSLRFLQKIIAPHDTCESRLKTFESWPLWAKQTPEKLAFAGFYYKGEGDKTVCFKCSGPLNNWEEKDDPWEQHALWYPKCQFIVDTKGNDFIDEVQQKLKREIPNDWINLETKAKDEEVDEDKLCIVCCSSQKEVILVPCGHDWTCVRCVRNLDDKKCPVCRELIIQIKTL